MPLEFARTRVSTNMHFFPVVSKARKPRFDVHLKIYDLNNVPLVSGVSLIKWYLPHSIHGEHRGRTHKSPIQNHRVEYNYSKIFSVRIGIDRNSNLVEYPIEFEVLQEFSGPGTVNGASGRDEKITLGTVRFNLAEYVEESEAILRDGISRTPALREILASPTREPKSSSGHRRKRSSLSNTTVPEGVETSPRSSHGSEAEDEGGSGPLSDVQDGVTRRYLMQDSKINSTLKISILMIQVDGERNYAAPAPKSAPVFGGIAGFVSGDALEPVEANTAAAATAHLPAQLTAKSRDLFEVQDMYRRALAASWASQPTELPADQCIEDIFAGGDGFRTQPKAARQNQPHNRLSHHPRRSPTKLHRASSGSHSDEDDASPSGNYVNGSTLPSRDLHQLRHHFRQLSGSSDGTAVALGQSQQHHERDLNNESSRGIGLGMTGIRSDATFLPIHRREESKITHAGGLRSRSSSLATTDSMISERLSRDGRGRSRDGFKRVREVDEFEVRDDLVAWTVPGRV
ncbi:N-terminal C2 in EEIG1 and EHBP1 proteins-domain-containing protein [Cladorrhinum samala]|uniref:N-terminal C2 in EEIG1 and EHBP1 proteins-domain-containing protein n=1 Tax=Cladorrhinum samala TaxID=585594 RepID=A0AAV9I0K1_9PEZI|nr:N-terminal C2 in EEIG1 and EHBP1 proteins-domain-containing protein [Cladorrhinum samala]